MVVIGRLKKVMKSVAKRLPFIEGLVRRSSLLRSILGRAGLMSSPRLADLSTDSLTMQPIRGVPRAVGFEGPFPSGNLWVYLGVTAIPAGLPDVRANILAKDTSQRVIRQVPQAVFEVEAAVPSLLQQRFPGVLRWYRHELGAGLEACDSLQVRFQFEALQGASTKGLECFCLTLGQASVGGEQRRLIDLVSGAPVRIQPGRS